ncbi:serine/threonine-protein kinase [Nocardiopsis sp. NPDC007018]|uniref:serine/threonine-protein kinase n=1 Tax=Nocardiopsis sp. NPDC007018 TaxID=3155721 RepID=UPI0033C69F39
MDSSAGTHTGVTPLDPVDPRYLGPYRLVGRLGTGGMGVVYAALDDRDRRVAVKCVHRVLASDADFRDRFAREVGLVRRVRATCVPEFLGADTRAEVPWLATEYVPGPTLAESVGTRGPLSGSALTGFAFGVAEALTAIHAAGVVHRDLKPGNVILAPGGPKVLDFGIARATDGTALTRTGGLVGTPGWISPEQYRGAPATELSDVFAWGGLVAHAATGQGPFGAGTSDVVVARILSEPPSLSGVPEPLRGVVARALAKDPDARPSAIELRHTLAGVLGAGGEPDATRVLERVWETGPVPEPALDEDEWSRGAPPRRGWARRHRGALVAVAGVTALALVVGIGLRALPGEGSPPTTEGGADDPTTSVAGNGTDDAGIGGGQGEPGEPPDGIPEEYRELYQSGNVVVEPEPGTESALVRRIEPASGEGEGLDVLRLTFGAVQYAELGDVRLTIDLEYLPDHGSLLVHSDEFVGVRHIRAGDDGLDFRDAVTTGVLADLDPEEPTSRVRVVFTDVRVVYHVPASIRGTAPEDLRYAGGLCVTPDGGGADQGAGSVEPHDTTMTDGALTASCAFTDQPEQT